MGLDKNIVALELGSSSVRAIFGQRKTDGTFQVLGFEKENIVDGIRKGVIYNIDKTTQAIVNVIKKLEDRQHVYVKRVYIGLCGQSLRTIPYHTVHELPTNSTITTAMVDRLIDESMAHLTMENIEVFEVIPTEYKADNHSTLDPIGIIAETLEASFQNIIARVALQDNIQRCLENAKLEMAGLFIAPQVLADYLLQDSEKRSGCTMVDMGAETTTVAVYEKNILQHLVVIPLGGNNITNDIATTFHIEFSEAENLKHTYGSAYEVLEEDDEDIDISISNNRKIKKSALLNTIEARQQEIIANIWEQCNKYESRMLSGIILTGGAANMKGILDAFNAYCHYEMVKVRLMPAAEGFTTNLHLDPHTTTLASILAMALRGKEECTTDKPLEPSLFEEEKGDPVFNIPDVNIANGTLRPSSPSNTPDAAVEPEQPKKEKKPSKFAKFWEVFKNKAEKAAEVLVEEK